MKISRMTKQDLPEVFKISQEQFLSHSWQMRLFESELEFENHFAFVLKVKGKIVCFVCYMTTESENRMEFNILNLATKKGCENRGYATKLLDFVKNDAKQKKFDVLWLEVRETNHKAIRFYQNYGFEKVHTRKRYYSNGDNAIIMSFGI